METGTITLKDPAKAGYTFEGWYMAKDFTGDAVTEIAQGSTGNNNKTEGGLAERI